MGPRLLVLFLLLIPARAAAWTHYAWPGDDWCQLLEDAEPGDEVVLLPGEHTGGCRATVEGVVLRSQHHAERASVIQPDKQGPLLRVEADRVSIRDLDLGPTAWSGVEVAGADDVEVTRCLFVGVGGVSIDASDGHSRGLRVVDDEFRDLGGTAVQLGAPDAAAADFVLEDNLVDRVQDGGGIWSEAGSWGAIRRNVVHDTGGTSVRLEGAWGDDERSAVERNLLVGARGGVGLEIDGGPARVNGNIVIGGLEGALRADGRHREGLVRSIEIVGNTFLGDGAPAVLLPGWGPGRHLTFANNAAGNLGAGPGLPTIPDGFQAGGNIDCDLDCWRDPEGWDLWPTLYSPLVVGAEQPWLEWGEPDFCGSPRETSTGAIEAMAGGGGALVIDFLGAQPCPEQEDDDWDWGWVCGGGGWGDPGCGCSQPRPDGSVGGLAPLALWLGLSAVLGRSRRR